MERREEKPYCFGNLDIVFPKGEDGLRHSPESCFPCIYKTQCLRAAIKNHKGLAVEQERVDRAYASGMIGFLGRWSRKKDIHRQEKRHRREERPAKAGK